MGMKMRGEDAAIRSKIFSILTRHIGKEKAIGMAELFEQVFGEQWEHRINDTRAIRDYIEALRDEGQIIGSNRSPRNPGYYLARSVFEANEIIRKYDREGIGKLKKAAAMRKISLPEYLGQLQMGLVTGNRDGLSEASK
jgi:hypothetical protein